MRKVSTGFYSLNYLLFAFFMAWTLVIMLVAARYSYWISIIALPPFFTSLLFLDIVLRIINPLWSLFVAYPILEFFVRLFGLDFSSFRKEVIGYSNSFIAEKLRKKSVKFSSKNILVLLPHCIQIAECEHRVSWENLANCKKCKRCPVSDFVDIRDKYGVTVAIVSGGSSAREMIKIKKPKLIIAVACENDLISGLRDVRRTPVIAVLNQITSGPCRDTLVDPDIVRQHLESFMDQIPLD